VPADALAGRLVEAIRGKWIDLFPDGFRPTIVPVPIRPLKYFRRGFNLPALVGAALSRRTCWPFDPLVLSRTGGDLPQAGLRLAAREKNVRGAFRVPARRESPSDALLLDDVFTSGATARACAAALKTAGAKNILVLTLARAVH
jgi:predicted amidophosphoribosyltransferase